MRARKNVVRINEKVSESFWTEKGVRVSCPLSLIFSLLIADVEEEMKKEQVGEVQVGRERRGREMSSLAYADDLVQRMKKR